MHQTTDYALRPKGATDAERIQENQPISQERLSEASFVNNYFMWSVQYSGTSPDLPVGQFTDYPNYFSEQWRFDEADAANEPF